jgi:O-methyltransferase involved in polyketide biosynthesis
MPLWARALETDRAQPLIRDPKAKEIVAAVDFDFDAFAAARVDVVGFCVRAVLVDRFVVDFLDRHDQATVVEMGVGLDSRFERLDNGRVRWFELDLPETIEIRRQFYEETPRRTLIGSSALEPEWVDVVARQREGPLLLIADAMFYFLTKRQVIELMQRLANVVPGSTLVFDCHAPWYQWFCNRRHPLRDSHMEFSLSRVEEIESWDRRFRVERCIGFGDRPDYDEFLPRFSWFVWAARRCIPAVRSAFRIVQVRLA